MKHAKITHFTCFRARTELYPVDEPADWRSVCGLRVPWHCRKKIVIQGKTQGVRRN